MSRIAIRIEAETYAGTSIENACDDLCALARRVLVNVHCSFNGVTLIARPTSDPRELEASWNDAIKLKRTCATTDLP